MADAPEIRTARLLLRGWRDEDRAPFAAMNADTVVMEHFPKLLSREESDVGVDGIIAHFARHGFGLWAVEVPGEAPFVGFIGLSVPGFDAPFMPCVEIGWRLATSAWGRGYATEGALASLAFGFGEAGLDEIVSFTSTQNERSQRVMQRIGMTTDPAEDFDHPRVPEGSPVRRHVLYRIRRPST